jgi:hypothetical protein
MKIVWGIFKVNSVPFARRVILKKWMNNPD